MAELTFPDAHRETIVSLLELSPDNSSLLLKRIQESGGVSATLIQIFDEIVGNGRKALRAVVVLAVLPRRFEMSVEDVEDSVKAAFDQEDSKFPLGALIRLREIQQFAKALDLRNSYERILLSTRIFSDVRPIFDDDSVSEVEAAMVNHSLQVRYRVGDDETDELQIAVDIDDLKQLREQIDRAFDKERSAKRFIEKGGAKVLEVLEMTDEQ